MGSTILAIVGTLLGAAVSGLFQHRSAARTERAARQERVRSEKIAAIGSLATAISDHRRAMWIRGDAALSGAPADQIERHRAESHHTRSRVSQPLTAVRLLVTAPEVRATADAAVVATYAMREASHCPQTLAASREEAVAAHDAFVDAAARHLQTADR